jgi:hypothetical protein
MGKAGLIVLTAGCAALLIAGLTLLPFPKKSELADWFCWTCWSGGGHHHHASEERPAPVFLKHYTSAQADFRSNDRDGDKVQNFWRGDIAGLYVLTPPGSDERVKLIEIALAEADDRATTALPPDMVKAPKAGYWFRAIRHADEKEKVDAEFRFAACAFPASYPKSGRWTYAVDERNSIFRRDLGRPGGIEVFPTDEELRTQWAKLD